jgi:integrase
VKFLHFSTAKRHAKKTRNSRLPNHKLYDLRTTFYTRCDEYGVAAPARDEFVGHSSGVLTNTYRDLSDEYLLKEGAKLNEWK